MNKFRELDDDYLEDTVRDIRMKFKETVIAAIKEANYSGENRGMVYVSDVLVTIRGIKV